MSAPPNNNRGPPLCPPPPSVPPAGMHERFQKDLWGLRLRAARSLAGSIGGGGQHGGTPLGLTVTATVGEGAGPQKWGWGEGECQYWGGLHP